MQVDPDSSDVIVNYYALSCGITLMPMVYQVVGFGRGVGRVVQGGA